MKNLKKVLASVLVALYGALVGVSLGRLSVYMYGLGTILALFVGLYYGAVTGWKMPLRDAAILCAGCFSGLVFVKWLRLAFAWPYSVEISLSFMTVMFSGLLCWLIQKHLPLQARLHLALVLIGSCAFNLLVFFAIRT